MRRLVSITTIVALMSSVALPLLAASCPHVKHAVSCHRTEVQAHHCNMKHDHHGDASDPEPDGPAYSASQELHSCPMDCCGPGQRTKAIAAPTAALISQLEVTDHPAQPASVVFESAGFSSHTDRGPPTA